MKSIEVRNLADEALGVSGDAEMSGRDGSLGEPRPALRLRGL